MIGQGVGKWEDGGWTGWEDGMSIEEGRRRGLGKVYFVDLGSACGLFFMGWTGTGSLVWDMMMME